MDAKECAHTLRSFIRHRERMHERETIFIDEDGTETVGKLGADDDAIYQALKFALPCVEEKITE